MQVVPVTWDGQVSTRWFVFHFEMKEIDFFPFSHFTMKEIHFAIGLFRSVNYPRISETRQVA